MLHGSAVCAYMDVRRQIHSFMRVWSYPSVLLLMLLLTMLPPKISQSDESPSDSDDDDVTMPARDVPDVLVSPTVAQSSFNQPSQSLLIPTSTDFGSPSEDTKPGANSHCICGCDLYVQNRQSHHEHPFCVESLLVSIGKGVTKDIATF